MSGAICGDGMCPYIPCKDCPVCVHFKNWEKENKKDSDLK